MIPKDGGPVPPGIWRQGGPPTGPGAAAETRRDEATRPADIPPAGRARPFERGGTYTLGGAATQWGGKHSQRSVRELNGVDFWRLLARMPGCHLLRATIFARTAELNLSACPLSMPSTWQSRQIGASRISSVALRANGWTVPPCRFVVCSNFNR